MIATEDVAQEKVQRRKKRMIKMKRDSTRACGIARRYQWAIEDSSPGRLQIEERGGLRRKTVGKSVRMKFSVVTQTEPGTILLRSLRYTILFTFGKVFP